MIEFFLYKNLFYAFEQEYLPVKVCNPAPTVEQKAPTIITHFVGQASTATTNCLLILSPNLSRNNEPCVHDAKNSTFDISVKREKSFFVLFSSKRFHTNS